MQGPEDQVVRPGSPATFYCVTHSTDAHWIINEDIYTLHSNYGNSHPSYNLTRSSDMTKRTNLTAVVETSSISRGKIVCACSLLNYGISVTRNHSLPAHWRTSCLGQ